MTSREFFTRKMSREDRRFWRVFICGIPMIVGTVVAESLIYDAAMQWSWKKIGLSLLFLAGSCVVSLLSGRIALAWAIVFAFLALRGLVAIFLQRDLWLGIIFFCVNALGYLVIRWRFPYIAE